MVTYPVGAKDPDSHLLFYSVRNKGVNISVGEIIGVRLVEGKYIIGVVDEICKDRIHIWIRSELMNLNSRRERINLKLDQIIKLS